MNYVEINARRDAYSVKDIIGSTLTVGELIEILDEYEEDTPVVLSHDRGYTYGALHANYFNLESVDSDEDEDDEYEDDEEDEEEADDTFDESYNGCGGVHTGSCVHSTGSGITSDDDEDDFDEDWNPDTPRTEEDKDNELFVYQWYWGLPDKDYQWFIDNISEEERKQAYDYFEKEGMSFEDKFNWFKESLGKDCTHCNSDDDDKDDFECDDDFGEHENSYDVDEAYSFKGLNDRFGGKTLAESLHTKTPIRKIKRK